MHFKLPATVDDIESATLQVPLVNTDPDLPLGDLDIYSFYGDGVASADEWNAGRRFHRIAEIAGEDNWAGGDRTGPRFSAQFFEVDVLSLLGSNQNDYVSFVLRPGLSSDRYWIGVGLDEEQLPRPSLTVLRAVPEPSAFSIIGIGLLSALGRRRRRCL